MRRYTLVLLCAALPLPLLAQDKTEKPFLVLDAGGHTDSIPRVLFTPNGKELISVSKDKTIRIWSVTTGEHLRTLRLPIGSGRLGTLYAAALSPDGQTLVVGGIGPVASEFPIYLIKYDTGRVVRVLKGHEATIVDLAISPDGKRLASGAEDRCVRIWDLQSGKCEQTLEGHTAAIYGVAFSPDGKRLVSGAFDATARIWSLATGKTQAVLKDGYEGRNYWVCSVAWSPDGKTVATGSFDQCLRFWEPDGTLRKRHGPLGDSVRSVAFSPDSREVLIARGYDRGKDCSMVDVATGKERVTFTAHTSGVWRGVLSPRGTLAATAGFLGEELFLWRTADASLHHRLGGRSRSTWSAAWSPDGKSVAWGNTGKRHYNNAFYSLDHSFNLETLELKEATTDKYRRAQPTLGGRSLQRVQGQDTVTVLEGDQAVSSLRLRNNPPTCYTFVGGEGAAVGAFFGVYLFDPRNGTLLRSFQGHTGDVWALSPSPDNRYLVSGAADQTLRVWSLDRDLPLLSLFFAGSDWIAWTPEGYYAVSPGGEKLMGWQVNNGPDKTATFYPAAQFRKALYRPDVIKKLLEAGSIEKALALADKERGKTTDRIEVGKVLPPRVVITAPARSGQLVPKDTVQVKATATSTGQHPVTGIRLLLDGRPYQGQAGVKPVAAPKLGEVSESWTVTLSPGKNKLQVLADSAVSQGLSEVVEVLYQGEIDPEVELPALYVLAVGVAAYPDAGLKLNYAARDAVAVAKVLKDNGKALFKKIEVKLLTDKDATRAEVLKALGWLRKEMRSKDYAVVFFSGHGDKDSDGSLYFLPYDVDINDLATSCIGSDQFKRMLVALPGKVVALLDACHSGGIDNGRRKSAASLTDDLVRDLVTDENGLVVMCSSTGREFSLENNEYRHSNFTQALVEGLSGKAAKSAGTAVYLHQLDSYVTDRVKELSKGQQHPVTAKPSSIRSFPLAKP